MKTTRITKAEITPISVSSLPSRPTAPTSFGGRGYSASDMKAAFDRLPLYIIERFNSLIDDIESGDIMEAMATGIGETKTLAEVTRDITSGALASYMAVGGMTLSEAISEIREDIAASVLGDEGIREDLERLYTDIYLELEALAGRDGEISVAIDRLDAELDSTREELTLSDDEMREEISSLKIEDGYIRTDISAIDERLSGAEVSLEDTILRVESLEGAVGDFGPMLDTLHEYAMALTGGDE